MDPASRHDSDFPAEPARSLRKRLSLPVIVVFLAAVPFGAAALAGMSYLFSRDEIERESRRLSGFIRSSLTQALWEIDAPAALAVGSTIARDWNVAVLRVSDERTVIFEFRNPLPKPFRPGALRSLRLERDGIFVGTAEYALDYRPYLSAALKSAAGLGAALLALLAGVLLALRFAILSELRLSLQDLTRLAASFGPAGTPAPVSASPRYREFDPLRELLVGLRRTIGRQIGELEESLAERDLLMREINHRVRNNLQLLASIIDQQAEASSRDKAVLRKLLDRIESIAAAYEQLWTARRPNGVRMDAYLGEIAGLVSLSGRFGPIVFETDFAPLDFSLDGAMNCGLIFYELAANAAEHAYGGKGGVVRASLRSEGTELVLSVADEGSGCCGDFRDPPAGGLGFRFVAALAGQLGARVEENGAPGCRFLLRFPALRAVHGAAETAARP